jgi:transposase InsO family protein
MDLICRVLEVSRSGYYAWLNRPESARDKRRQELAVAVRRAHVEHRSVYGAPRVHAVLAQQGISVNVKTVAGIMKDLQLQGKKKRKFVPRTTDSLHDRPVYENRLDRDFTAQLPNQKWTCDITYIPTAQGWMYLAGVIDLCSRRIVGWALADHMRTDLVQEALNMALVTRRPAAGLLHHSDRGSQYASEDYVALLEAHGVTISMSQKGNCWDNAVTESLWSSLKCELISETEFKTREDARLAIFEYIEVFYNRKRLHSALGYRSPEAFEAGLN